MCLTQPNVCGAEEPTNQNRGLLNSLQANRSLLSKYQKEYILQKKEQLSSSTDVSQRKLADLEQKIKALEEDSEELQSFLPMSHRAEEFVWDLMSKKMRVEKIKLDQAVENLMKETELKRRMATSSDEAQSAYQMHERALNLVTEGQFKEAVQLYEEIVLRNPDDDEAYLIMGHTYLLMGLHKKAERAFNNAVHIDEANIREITPFYENAILQNPDSDTAYTHLGYAQLIVGNIPASANAFTEALRINPENQSAQSGLMYLERLASQVLQ